MADHIPVVLFAYARPDLLHKTLGCLRANAVPLIYAFSDGPASMDKEPAVKQVRRILRQVDWCDLALHERDSNWGLGRSILDGVGRVLSQHDAAIVFEDDLFCVPGTYEYLASALCNYRDEPRVMSVTGWTHPLTTPSGVTTEPYFDGRAECWVWGTWARVWGGMSRDAESLMRACKAKGIDVYRYGADLPGMAKIEHTRNIWAVRFLYLHILNQGLCLRPPWSMVEHMGFDARATNASDAGKWANPPLRPCLPLPTTWPVPAEDPACAGLWQAAYGSRPTLYARLRLEGRRLAGAALRRIVR